MSRENREVIRLQALKLFAERGYEAVGVQEIVLKAGITKPTMYHYFGDKRTLLAEIISVNGDELLDRIRRKSSRSNSLETALSEAASSIVGFAVEHLDFYRLYLSLWFAPPESDSATVARPYHQSLFELMKAIFEESAEGSRQFNHAAEYAFSFLGQVHTYIGAFLGGAVSYDRNAATRIMHRFLNGIMDDRSDLRPAIDRGGI